MCKIRGRSRPSRLLRQKRAVKLVAMLSLVQIPARSMPTCENCLRDNRPAFSLAFPRPRIPLNPRASSLRDYRARSRPRARDRTAPPPRPPSPTASVERSSQDSTVLMQVGNAVTGQHRAPSSVPRPASVHARFTSCRGHECSRCRWGARKGTLISPEAYDGVGSVGSDTKEAHPLWRLPELAMRLAHLCPVPDSCPRCGPRWRRWVCVCIFQQQPRACALGGYYCI